MAVYAEERGAPTLVEAVPAADPAPLGLAAFALTTFILSGHNATFIPDVIWVGLAMFYGGLTQLLAGMWEFRNRNVFGATAFSTYGGFWLSLGVFVILAETTKLGAGPEGAGRPQLARVVPARVRDLQHVHAHVEHAGERRGLRRVRDARGDGDPPRDRLLPRGARRQRLHHAPRRLGRHRHRRLRVVCVGRRRHQRHVAAIERCCPLARRSGAARP